MRSFARSDHTIRLSLMGLILTLIYFGILSPLGFLHSVKTNSADQLLRWRNTLLAPPSLIDQILLVSADEESQRFLNQRWPWDRKFFADFLHSIEPHAPKLVVLDFAFIGESQKESDEALERALRAGPPILLASYLDSKGQLVKPHTPFLKAGGIPCLINKPLDQDSVIRRMWTLIPLPGESRPLIGIEVAAAAIAQGVPLEEIRREGRILTLGNGRVPVGPLATMNISYAASPKAFLSVPFWKFLKGEVNPDLVRDKLVIVGSDREITHDVHTTPLGRMPGMTVSASGILMLLSGQYLKEQPAFLLFPAALLLTLALILAGAESPISVSLPLAFLTCLFTIGAELGLSCLGFSAEFVGPLFLCSTSWLMGLLYKYLRLASMSLRLQRQMAVDPITGSFSTRYFRLRLEEEFRRCGPKRPMSLIAVQTVGPSEMVQSRSWEEVRMELKGLTQQIQGKLPRHAWMGRLSGNRWGIAMPWTTVHQAKDTAQQLQETLRSNPYVSGLAVGCSSQASFSSADALLSATEKTLDRARAKGSVVEIFDPALDAIIARYTSAAAQEGFEYVASELEERNQSLEEALDGLRHAHQEMETAFLEVTKSLVLALETKDAYTAGHLERVSRYSSRLAEELGLPKDQVGAIQEAALLHDIGKIGLPDEVLHKVGSLTDQEKEIIKEHLSIGAKILEPMKFFRPITTLIYHHHERYDGKGYPHGLTGDFIPAGAQVIAIADSFDAMTTNRGYNKPMTAGEALAELRRGAGTQFNPGYVERFCQLIEKEGPHLAGYVPH